MRRKRCKRCLQVFIAEREWEQNCIVCWKEKKGMDLLAGDKQVVLLQGEILKLEEENERVRNMVKTHNRKLDQLRSQHSVESKLEDRIKDLLKLCHPDRHNNSDKATDVTRWLIQVRKQGNA